MTDQFSLSHWVCHIQVRLHFKNEFFLKRHFWKSYMEHEKILTQCDVWVSAGSFLKPAFMWQYSLYRVRATLCNPDWFRSWISVQFSQNTDYTWHEQKSAGLATVRIKHRNVQCKRIGTDRDLPICTVKSEIRITQVRNTRSCLYILPEQR